jgi:hypothetical protein
MQVRNRFAWVAVVMLTAVTSMGDESYGIKLNPGERIVAINGVPVEKLGIRPDGTVVGSSSSTGDGVIQASALVLSEPSAVQPAMASNIVGNLVRSGMPFSHTPGESALEKANYERRRNGVGDLIPDPQLQELALQKATIAAQRRYKNHIGGSLGGARAEGVGHTQGRFLSCCLDMHATYGGAAMVQGADGWYCCLLVR